MEIWRNANTHETQTGAPARGFIQISNLGRARRVYANGKTKILKPQHHNKGYYVLQVYRAGVVKHFLIHRLVAQAFIPNPDNKPFVNHINGIKTDNRVENLEWCTQAENVQHAYKTRLTPTGENRSQAKLSNDQVEWCRSVYIPDDHEFGQIALAKKLNVDQTTIKNAVRGISYKQVSGQIHQKFSRKISENIRQEIRRLFIKGSLEFGARALSRKFGISKSTVLAIIKD